MGNAIYIVVLFPLIFMFLKLESIRKYCNKFLKVSRGLSDKKCSCTSGSSDFLNCVETDEVIDDNGKSNVADCQSILENIGYFVASNDEKKPTKYCPTSLQDIDPNGLA